MPKSSKAFTLVEVLVSVMIISVVIGALIQLFATNSHSFASVHQKILQTNKTTLLLGNPVYGYENKTVDLAELLKDFDLDNALRRKLKREKVEIIYTEVTSIDFGDAAESLAEAKKDDNENSEAIETETGAVTNSLEVGRTTFKLNNQSSSFLRVKLQ